MFFPIFSMLYQEKSGNPDTDLILYNFLSTHIIKAGFEITGKEKITFAGMDYLPRSQYYNATVVC
jgi:hypothetical protein